jgi:hypothetical protein
MVKPILLYGTPAWQPGKTNVNKIERVQRRALKFIHGSNPPVDQKKLMPVAMQLRYNNLHFFKKCETGDIDCDVRQRIEPRRETTRTTGLAEQAFAFRVVGPWNNLPDRL